MSAPPQPLTIPLADRGDAEAVAAALRRHLASALAGFLPRQRWYGDKGRPLASVALLDAAADGDGPPWFVLAIAEVAFADGSPSARYLLPLATAEPGLPSQDALAFIQSGDERWALVDAFAVPGFPLRLLRRLAQSAHLGGDRGAFVWEAFPALSAVVAGAEAAPSSLIGTEYSNSSVRFGDLLFLKLVRRLRPGTNPDEEVGRFLAERTGFRHAPAPLGAGRYLDTDGTPFPFALAQRFVAGAADGWTDVVARIAAAGNAREDAELLAALNLLGRRTAQLHAALATPSDDAAFAPEPVAAADAEGWQSELTAKLAATPDQLAVLGPSVPPRLRALVDCFAEQLPDLRRRAAGFAALTGTPKTRVHGDYHLGQTLRTPDGDWVILDFEGEPARTLPERRAKTSPLKDVAGLLRSLGYARGAALGALPPADRAASAPRLAAWERAARGAFLGGYRAAAAAHPSLAWTADPARFEAGLAAWELDKAIYEVAYEANNRPDWLDLPLAALLDPP